MKKILTTLIICLSAIGIGHAQKFALVDMEYIMKAIPAYETANEQLTQLSKRWEKEVENKLIEVQTMYKNYQTEVVFLSEEMKKQREEEIIAKEKAANELKRKYFGAEGDLFKKRESLMKPMQEEIYNAMQAVCNEKGYQMVLDKASSMNLIFASPKLDISDEVLDKLGYSK
ncbi:MAG TPA: OmpH family outer membrane protein [Paludibacteraceae bacterium]|nr:OmpH family outer membrane protein [Paludibacteraceae bacterium]HPO47438.1 OmpH family outer membrane protein [Paludibacteraceae bacterium]